MNLKAPIRDLLDEVRNRPAVRERLLYWAHGPEFRRWCRAHPCEEFAERTRLYRRVSELPGMDGPIDYLEFGVSRGDSMRWWVGHNKHPEATFVGFDTFDGIPESWTHWPKGSFTANGKAPEIVDGRCSFVKGLFQDTVPGWVDGRDFSRPMIVHLDADLYSSTLVALSQLLPKIKAGDILIFDEFSSYLHEYRAYVEVTTSFGRTFELIGRALDWTQVAMRAT